MTGRVHSFETLGALDGPGLRCVVFLQGCPLRCQTCHNPDTWSPTGGTAMTVAEVVARVSRLRPYFGREGGVTLSGGEPLAQPHFAAAILRQCRALGVHTALDTSGVGGAPAARIVLPHTDLVICDLKATDAGRYRDLTGGSLTATWDFLRCVTRAGVPLWVRQVIVPGWNDTEADAQRLGEALRKLPTLARVELLPYHTLGLAKWEALGRPSPLCDVPPADPAHVARLEQLVRAVAQGQSGTDPICRVPQVACHT
jgi:pyruvate formate lyase activating enzyme